MSCYVNSSVYFPLLYYQIYEKMKITKFIITDYWSYIQYHQNLICWDSAIFGYTFNRYLSKPPNRCLYSFGSYLLPFRCYNQIRKHLMSRSWWVYMRASTQWNTRKLIVTKGKGNPAMFGFTVVYTPILSNNANLK